MASKSISITEEVYDLLKQSQLKGESFSQTIMRFLTRQENFLTLAGAWTKIPESADAIRIIEETVKEARNRPTDQINLI